MEYGFTHIHLSPLAAQSPTTPKFLHQDASLSGGGSKKRAASGVRWARDALISTHHMRSK